ncbi:putative Ser/Thr protein kinase [Candidatus Nitrososphaera evergladensis SR1]|uniref:Putative Ser/Thr protein kinase n=1 Tax=Candidatus Nitrososphaera evergladensis SR1 TaxID=1459636 RepID=A0A075MWQ9_9ARCH|nr:serine/threonine protein kinase [Candidatus Nitrososphaera evergladensis]AIF85082.1 putative Ser/Thr protein kinase [Candidatus Nitrososphaera evergladensis SR1]
MSRQRISFSSSSELVLGSPELAKILTYPRGSDEEYASRLAELKGLGVTAVFAGGRTVIGGTSIAGKGCVGLVVRAKAHGRTCALKIRRTDANRPTMHDEVKYHRIANGAGVGPELVGYSDNFMLMEFAEGTTIAEWAQGKKLIDIKQASAVARSALEQCYALDRAGLDHGELSHVDRHIIVDNDTKATTIIIDFESASTERKPSNVSAAGQSLLVSGAVASTLAQVLRVDREAAIGALKKYKRDQTRENFDAILALVAFA